MLAPSPTPDEQPSRLVTEAEAIANLLLDMDVPLTARLDSPDLLFQVSRSTPSGAVAVMKVAIERFEEDESFREDMIAYLGTIGDYVAGAPGIASHLKSEPASIVVAALNGAGLCLHPQSTSAEVGFIPLRHVELKPNAHLLMRLVEQRSASEPAFLKNALNYGFAISNPCV